MSRRRSRWRRRHGRKALFGTAAVLAVAGWAAPGEMVLLAAAGLLALFLLGVPALTLLAPRSWRIRYRHWEHRPFFWAPYGREHARSARIPARVDRAVRAADRNRCVAGPFLWRAGLPAQEAGCRGRREVDHVVPWAAGGRARRRNLALLCQFHNDVKSNYSVDRDGYVHYRPFTMIYPDANNRVLAAMVLEAELRARRRPGRWVRAELAA